MIAVYMRHNRSARSYRLQRQQLGSRLESDGVTEHELFLDSGHGLLFNRPAFSRLRECLEAGGVDALYTTSLDRLTRDVNEAEQFICLCRATATPLITFDRS